jgi:hypothetical protein
MQIDIKTYGDGAIGHKVESRSVRAVYFTFAKSLNDRPIVVASGPGENIFEKLRETASHVGVLQVVSILANTLSSDSTLLRSNPVIKEGS